MKISKRLIILSVLGLLFLIVCFNGCSSYNKMTRMYESVGGQWSQVENVYQRRMDLIPNIVATVKKYSEFEKSTLEAVVSARAKATQVTIDADNLDAESLQKFEAAQDGLSSALGRLLMVTENYPDLKTSEKFNALITQLEGSENRITVERMRFNTIVKDYNITIKEFPRKFWAGVFGFEKKEPFKMKEGADVAPDVEQLFDK